MDGCNLFLWIIRVYMWHILGNESETLEMLELHKLFFLFHQLGMMKLVGFCRTWS